MNIQAISNNKTEYCINFGLTNRNFANSIKLLEYWRSKGFSERHINSAMNSLEHYASESSEKYPFIDFIISMFAPNKYVKRNTGKYPAIDFGEIKQDRITRCTINVDAKAGEKATETVDMFIPNITYKFITSDLKIPFNKEYVTPLEQEISTMAGDVVEPIAPMKIVKKIISNFKAHQKEEHAPHRYLRPEKVYNLED